MALFSERREGIPHLPLHMVLVTFTLFTIYPILWVVSLAFSGKQSLAIATLPENPTFWDRLRAVTPWPETFSVSNFASVMADQPFAKWMLNSAIVAIGTTVLGVFMACTAAYAFSRFKFPGQRAGMMAFLVSQMFPGTLMLIPLYIILVQWLGLGSSRLGLIIVYATTSIPFSVWMLKGYFDTIPKDLEEAALMDGASPGRIFWSIILPLAKPAVAVTALFSFMTAWNEFILAATFMDQEAMYTAPVGLRFFVGGFSQQWGYFAAGSIIVSVPVVFLFLFLQKYLVSGLTAGGVKG
ncbi:sugar ABC transporter permease [Corallococcus sp. CA054B]|uniref:Maltose/maltodextrin transport system permease protein MalG n=1 Tax=Corallococcus coralloides (strain ATCC 25202 / DSM 2259 / NBRC 100086 / M2) TaxID=1144275 RepID=H8MY92_CORCM|nr:MULTISPECIES: sugar ABC transporter permease [Corallococcus]AFE08874.1 putative sugar ABC transporter permease [Corallococcus coralloides DSM 2259]RKG69286.1 sugar ABC transporter permease [Corallococcus sp. CA054B]